MAYYDALIAAWNGTTQPPTGVNGQPLQAGDTTAQKVAKVNGWTQTGSIPTSVLAQPSDIANTINYLEFKALTTTQQSNVLGLLAVSGGQLLGGSSNTSLLTVGMVIDYFPAGGQTIQNMQALARALTETWCQNNGYPFKSSVLGALTTVDASNAGLV
jgi:hypothetical protein